MHLYDTILAKNDSSSMLDDSTSSSWIFDSSLKQDFLTANYF